MAKTRPKTGLARLLQTLRCIAGDHDWLGRANYRRICLYCPRQEIYLPDQGWAEIV